MGTTKRLTKSTQAVLAEKLAAGATKHFPKGMQMPIGGATLGIDQIAAQLTSFASLRNDTETARAAYKAKLAAEANHAPAMNAFIHAFVQVVRGSFGSQPDVLADFGLQPMKAHTPLTVEQKAAASAKRAATRAARGTKGSKAKQAIHGDVTGVVVTPVMAGQPSSGAAATGTSATASSQGQSATATPAARS
jgi:hypothetical protein